MLRLATVLGMTVTVVAAVLVALTGSAHSSIGAFEVNSGAPTPSATPTATALPCSISFHGRVADSQTGSPIASAYICLNPSPCVYADSNGVYQALCYPGGSALGTYMCTTAPGYQKMCQGPWTPDGSNLEVNFSLAPVASPTPTSTPTPAPPLRCVGDCQHDGSVTVDELVTMVNIALGNAAVATCTAGDADANEQITIDEVISAVNVALQGCSPQPTPTPTPNCEIVVSGEVYDSTAGPTQGISGARVSVQLSAPRNFAAITGADGRYTLSVPNPYGCLVQRLDVEASGYTGASISVTAEDLLAHPVRDFALAPLAVVRAQ